MKFGLNQKNKRRLLVVTSVAAVITLLLVLLPIGLRWAAAKWLTDQGVVTQIDDIDLNLFTGTLAIANARGQNDEGEGFHIEHALVNLRYWPLFSKQIYLYNLELSNSRVDVKTDKDGQLTVAGLALGGGEEQAPPEEESTPWGFGLDRAAIGNVTLHYQQPGFDREITLSSSTSSDIATWEPNQPIPVNADLSIEKSQIKLRGQVKPFGKRIIGELNLGIADFDLEWVAPLARQAGVERLAGQLNSDLDIKLDYQAQSGLGLGIDGSAKLNGAGLALPDLNVNHTNIKWQGKIDTRLLSQAANTDQIKTEGHLSVCKLDVTLPQNLAFQQAKTDWQGKLNANLGQPITVLADGALKLGNTHLALFEPPTAKQTSVQDIAPAKLKATQQSDAAAKTHAPAQGSASKGEDTNKPADDSATTATQAEKQTAQAPVPKNNDQATAQQPAGTTVPAGSQATPKGPENQSADDNKPTEVATAGKPLEKPQPEQPQPPHTLIFDQGNTHWQGKVDLTLAKLGPKVSANGQLITGHTHLQLPADNTDITQANVNWQGELHLQPGDKGPSVKTKGKLATQGTRLALPASGISLRQDAVNWDGSANYGPGDPARIHASGALSADGLNLTQEAMAISGGHFQFTGSAALDANAEDMPDNAELPVALSGEINATQITVTDRAQNKVLANLDDFSLADINITGLNNMRSGTLTANGLAALERAKDAPQIKDYPYIATVKNLTIKQLALTGQSRLAIDTFDVDGINALLYRGKDGSVEASQWFASSADDSAADTPQAPATEITDKDKAEPASLQIALGRGLIHDSEVAIDDRGVEPAFHTQLSNLRIGLADVDSAKPAQGSALNISSALGRYGSIKADGFISPFQAPPSATLTGKINAVNLAPISGYTAQAIDRRIDQGTFSADLKFDMDRGALDANAKLKLTKLRIGGEQTESGIVKHKLGLPLNKILGLLRDRDGNITLNLPVGGNIENPEFSIIGIVRKAIFKSLQSAVMVIYAPLGIIKAGAGLINLGHALRPDPILFEPGKTALDNSDKTFLDKTAELMTKRPETELIVCGHSVPADRTAMELPRTQTTEGETPATPEQLASARDTLLGLAGQRGSTVGDYLVSRGIAPQRLVLCNPSLGEDAKAEPRTSMEF